MAESSATAGAGPHAAPPSPHAELTSFNLLPPEGDAGEASFAPWQLLSRVRDVLTGAATAQAPAGTPNAAHAPDAERARTQPASAGASSASGGKSGTAAPPGSRMPSLSVAEPNAAAPRKASGVSASSGLASLASGSSQRRTSSTLSKPVLGSAATVSLLRSSGESSYPSTAATSRATARSLAPFALRSTRASALTSTANAHAHAAKDAGEGDTDSLGALNSSRPSPWGAVPGFPLPRDLLADDARSIRSTSSRPRSELDFPSISMPNVASTSALGARASPAPSSAEAIRRLREGAPGGDRRFWLPDHHAAACGGCGMQFSTWRRRHHCRTCYLVFCASCASTMLPTRGANGLPGPPARTCDGCVKLLRDTGPSSMSRHRRARLDSTASSGPSALEKTDISAPLEASTHSPQAEFGANALFARSRGLPSTLSMGGMAGFGQDWDDERMSRPATPDMAAFRIDRRISEEEGVIAAATAPFRRGLGDEDKAPATPDEDLEQFMQRAPGEAAVEAAAQAASTSARQPVSGDAKAEGPAMSRTVPLLAFPTRSSDSAETAAGDGGDISPNTRSRLTSDAAAGLSSDARSRLVSDAALRAFRRSRLRTRTTLDDVHGARDGEDGSGSLGVSRRDSYFGVQGAGAGLEAVPAHGLGPVSLAYLRTMLAQCLVRARIPDTHNWAHILLPLILTVCSKVRPRPRAGEACDVRAYLKLKRIPGGEPSDSVYVPGVVLSKHVATKRMARNLPLVRPRVMLLAFPLDFGTQGLTSLDRAMHEKEYTRVLIARIVQLRPNLLVVRDNVSRLAIDMLEVSRSEMRLSSGVAETPLAHRKQA
jgi:1-phosphatidylinositol-3-phosphate 5-kinase